MNLQTLSIILIIIILPITLILSAYTKVQIDTLALQTRYKTQLKNATYDAVVAFQLNTVQNSYSTVSDSMRRDISAVVQTFMTNLAGNMGMSGATENAIKPYIPAIVFTLYDGYYIYSPSVSYTTDNAGNEKRAYEHVLKPYIYYTARYVNEGQGIDIIVNYSLDNYVVITGNVGSEGYVTKAGYLIANRQEVNENETLTKTLPVTTMTYTRDNSTTVEKTANETTFDIEVAEMYVTSPLMQEDRLHNGKYLQDTSLFKEPLQLSINQSKAQNEERRNNNKFERKPFNNKFNKENYRFKGRIIKEIL